MTERLEKSEIEAQLPKTWLFDGEFISREFKFSDFTEAFAFMTRVAFLAEKADHHPNWENVYNRVFIKLQTHDAGGVTSKDLALAQKIASL